MHKKGVEAERYVKMTKETFAKILKVQEKEIFFTSGGTESDNLALIGAARANARAGKHLIMLRFLLDRVSYDRLWKAYQCPSFSDEYDIFQILVLHLLLSIRQS